MQNEFSIEEMRYVVYEFGCIIVINDDCPAAIRAEIERKHSRLSENGTSIRKVHTESELAKRLAGWHMPDPI